MQFRGIHLNALRILALFSDPVAMLARSSEFLEAGDRSGAHRPIPSLWPLDLEKTIKHRFDEGRNLPVTAVNREIGKREPKRLYMGQTFVTPLGIRIAQISRFAPKLPEKLAIQGIERGNFVPGLLHRQLDRRPQGSAFLCTILPFQKTKGGMTTLAERSEAQGLTAAAVRSGVPKPMRSKQTGRAGAQRRQSLPTPRVPMAIFSPHTASRPPLN